MGTHTCVNICRTSFADPVAICDMNEARAREIADEFGIRKVYTDYHDMAADEEIDAVAIVTPGFCTC